MIASNQLALLTFIIFVSSIGCNIEEEESVLKTPVSKIGNFFLNGEKTLEIYFLPQDLINCPELITHQEILDTEPYLLYRGRADILNQNKLILKKYFSGKPTGILFARVLERKSDSLIAYSCEIHKQLVPEKTIKIKLEINSDQQYANDRTY